MGEEGFDEEVKKQVDVSLSREDFENLMRTSPGCP